MKRRKLKAPKLKYAIGVDDVVRMGGNRPAKSVTLSWEGRTKTFELDPKNNAPMCVKTGGPNEGWVMPEIFSEMLTKAAAILKGIDD